MISEEDLMLGNWIKDSRGRMIKLDSKRMSELFGDAEFLDTYYPIPLSPEILEKIEGFNRETKITISKVYNDIGQVFTLNKVDGKYFLTWGDLEVKTLHQLQNIYYFFTGTELIINL